MAQLSASCHGWQAQRTQRGVTVPLPGCLKQGLHTPNKEMGNTCSRKGSIWGQTSVFPRAFLKPDLFFMTALICSGRPNKIP